MIIPHSKAISSKDARRALFSSLTIDIQERVAFYNNLNPINRSSFYSTMKARARTERLLVLLQLVVLEAAVWFMAQFIHHQAFAIRHQMLITLATNGLGGLGVGSYVGYRLGRIGRAFFRWKIVFEL